MEIPTARVLREGQYRLGAGQVHPYRYYYGAVSPLPGLELEGHITEVIDVPALTGDYGNYKDKTADLKYQFWAEGKWMPALALGFLDSHGTRIYPSFCHSRENGNPVLSVSYAFPGFPPPRE